MNYSLDDLSLFPPWPARLLELESFSAREKNKAEIEREFGRDKWGQLLQMIKSGSVNSLSEADLLFNPEKDTFISYSLHYIQGIPKSFINFLRKIKPRAVILFESCPDFDNAGVYSLLKKKYMQVNNYNPDILSSLKNYEEEDLIKIDETIPPVFGINPLLPASVIIFTLSSYE